MKFESLNKIVFIGAGNVATHLATSLKNAGKSILQVYNHNESSAKELASKTDASFTNDISKINLCADLYIISVSDKALPLIAAELNTNNKFTVHTSGFHSLEAIKEISKNTGVFYPLQTFTKNRTVDFSDVPVCIEANSKENLKVLENLACQLSSDIRYIDSAQRKWLHIAAVFACNFSNYMYSIAEEILQEQDIPFDILKPLIKETAAKITEHNPSEVQTGPAIRGDKLVTEQHLKILAQKKYKHLYEMISDNIIKEKTYN